MKKLFIMLILFFTSQSQAMEDIAYEEIERILFLNAVDAGEVNEFDCCFRSQDLLDEALYNATFHNRLAVLEALFHCGANPNSIAAKLAYIKALLANNQAAIEIFKHNGTFFFNTIEEAFIYAINCQAADLIYDFMKMYILERNISEIALKEALKISIKKSDWLLLTYLVINIDIELNNFALYHAAREAFASKDTSLVKLIINAGINKESIYAKQALTASLLGENTELRRILFEAGITLDYIRLKLYKARKAKEKK